ncbi:hypothetical protein GCM10010441_12760 [Kitasatospora paracochleata]|uniref:Acyltransferase 3 domain-containing protein n=1 Tax=Kitasatospora paracochleata TaxID=58354 RepID=A0ABT1ITU2_9ACTN|nr:acyltransferase family protein [Kitasatospora paracochleata]MCP2308553.1 hypothetical protein [Kitasatospora paracochleata]
MTGTSGFSFFGGSPATEPEPDEEGTPAAADAADPSETVSLRLPRQPQDGRSAAPAVERERPRTEARPEPGGSLFQRRPAPVAGERERPAPRPGEQRPGPRPDGRPAPGAAQRSGSPFLEQPAPRGEQRPGPRPDQRPGPRPAQRSGSPFLEQPAPRGEQRPGPRPDQRERVRVAERAADPSETMQLRLPTPPAPSAADRASDPSETMQLRVPVLFAPDPVEEEVEAAPAPKKKGGRDRYFDLLRALALGRVILYHKFGWSWLPLVFPSMGVMFALAGSLMVVSLRRPALTVIRDRLRRLLPPMWLFGALLLTLMILDGWGPNSEGHPNWWWGKLAFWVLPLSTPPYGAELSGFHGLLEPSWAENIAVPLWYLRAYLWFVLLSPLMLRALRWNPWITIFTPLAASAVINSGLFSQEGRIWETTTDFTTFAACWILGMAHREGVLRRLPQYLAPSIAPMIMMAGLWWLLSRPITDPTTVGDIETVPFAQAIWSFGYVLLLLHLSPSWEQWPPRLERWNGVVSLLNARAVSVYLWHIPAMAITVPLMDRLWDVGFLFDHAQFVLRSQWAPLLIALPLLALLVLCFGWMEDLAARRPLRLFPYPRRPRGKRRAG